MAHDVGDTLPDLRDEVRLDRPRRRLEGTTDEEEGRGGDEERRRVDGDRRPGTDRQGQDAGDTRSQHEADVEDGLEDRIGPAHLGAADEARDRRRVGGQPQDAQGIDRERDEEDHAHRRTAEGHRDRDAGCQDGPAEVGTEHHLPPIEPIGERSGRQAEEQVRQRPEGADDAHRDPGTGQGEDEDRQGSEGDGVADRRQALADEDDLEVAVPR